MVVDKVEYMNTLGRDYSNIIVFTHSYKCHNSYTKLSYSMYEAWGVVKGGSSVAERMT
jgi:hypothetical protein